MDFDSEKIIEGVVIYTDGAAEPNPGPGGFGVVLLCGGRRKELSDGFAKTTNNRMELLGVTWYIEEEKDISLKPEQVKLSGSWNKAGKIKHKNEGEPCRKCQTPLIKRMRKKKKIKPRQAYYYLWHLYCPECRVPYMVEEAKRFVETDGLPGNATDNSATLF